MKSTGHPTYIEARVVCACGNTFTTGSTKPELRVEVCAQCHPFYTGKQNLLDVEGRVDRFKRRYAKSKAAGDSATAETAPSA